MREDATQALEILHDPTEDKYNIDMVSSDYAMSLSPPCTSTFSQPCYLVHRQNFMSQDGMTGLMIGLALIKRYIPESAVVTTCDGTQYRPLLMAKTITSAMVDRADDAFNNRISWPGSPGCCAKEVFLSNSEGGQLMGTIHGFKHAADYIDDRNRRSNLDEWASWSIGLRGVVQITTSAEAKLWLRLKALGWDMGEERHATKTLFNSAIETQNVEILSLINNLLYPGGENLSTDQAFFADLLCSAPCGGSCIKHTPYEGETDQTWPVFGCTNNPQWNGQRWETAGTGGDNRQFNGLDFMALYNIYMLHYNQSPQDYYNPDRPEHEDAYGADNIAGPSVLCKDQTAYYEAQPIYFESSFYPHFPSGFFEEIHWTSSSSLNALTPTINGTDVEAIDNSYNAYIEAKVKEFHSIPMYWTDGTPRYGVSYAEYCDFTFRKPITAGIPEYTISTDFDHCNHDYWLHAIGPDLDDASFLWTLEFYVAGGGTSSNNGLLGKDKHLTLPFPGENGAVLIKLKITTDCGEKELIAFKLYDCEYGGRSIAIAPNPARDHVYVGITDEYTIASEGLAIRFVNTGLGTIQGTRNIYSNGDMVDISDFPEGSYNVQATLSDNSVVNTSLLIARD